jgi:peptidoglycan/LPS O-acetylase OafA/YrhL
MHLDHLDEVRAAAALMVICTHAWLQVWNPDGRHVSRLGSLIEWLVWGHFAVGLFIVISGFCLMLPVVRTGNVLRGGARSFISRRARRIVSPLLSGCLVLADPDRAARRQGHRHALGHRGTRELETGRSPTSCSSRTSSTAGR